MPILCLGANLGDLAQSLAKNLNHDEGFLRRKIIAVPSQTAKYWILRELAQICPESLAGIDVLTLHQLMLETFSLAGARPPQVTEDKRYLALLWQLLQQDPQGFSYPERDPYPTVSALYNILRELRDAAVTGDEALWLASPDPYEGLPPLETERSRRLFLLYHRYLKIVQEHNLTDSPNMALQAADLLEKKTVALSEPVWVWGFFDFLGVQKIYLKALARKTQYLNIMLVEHAFTRNLQEEIIGWNFKKKKVQATGETSLPATTIISCPTPREEARAIAGELLRLNQNKNVAWHECAVVYRNPQVYTTQLKRMFLEHDIPFCVMEDPLANLKASPLGQALMALIKYLEKPTAGRLIELMSEPMSKCPRTIAEPVKNLSSRLMSLKNERLIQLLNAGEIISMALKILNLEAATPPPQRSLIAQETLRWVNLQATSGQAKLWRLVSKTVKPPKDPSLKKSFRQFIETLRYAPPAQSLNAGSRAFFLQLLEETLAAISWESSYAMQKTSGVWLISAHEARAGNFKHAFICGASDGIYPMEPKENPFLTDIVRRRLNTLGFVRFKESGAQLHEDALLFKLLTETAKENIFITYPQVNEEGQPRLASPYLAQGVSIEKFQKGFTPIAPPPQITAASGCGRRSASGAPGPAAGGHAVRAQVTAVSGCGRIHKSEWINHNSRDLSPTALADFVSCPQAFWWKRIIKAAGVSSAARFEFYPAQLLGHAFSEAMAQHLENNKQAAALAQQWRHNLKTHFPSIDLADLSAKERYKMQRADKILTDFEIAWGRLRPQATQQPLQREKVLPVAPLPHGKWLSCRVDLMMGESQLLEFKFTSRSVFGAIKATRAKPWQMLERLLKTSAPEGPKYGLQILCYLLYAQKEARQAEIMMVNPYWEKASTEAPLWYSWPADADLNGVTKKLNLWLKLYVEGFADHDEILFPLIAHEGWGERCQWCPYQLMCLKDVPEARQAHEKIAAPLTQAFNEGELIETS